MFKKIMLATDGSEHSARSAKYAIELAEKFDGKIEIVYAVDGQTSKSDVLHHANKFEVDKKRKEKIKAVKNLLESSGVEYETNILHGEAGPTIVEHANENEFDCVVIGSRGLNNLQTLILGSVSHKVAKRADCPVLIVK
ncbi:Nucleotide-binding universal stress protein, UspA family [Virgibacillus subterraneus]|uniref:Nucleotide-binding universal stress protein, UspA family n=1 Tax=Virgibacillus subterraneus TaxID=621109 RepID=A0A1H9K040_9BACI|nr:universal stress protein [Virgibacillus subterraneus]SEQ92273.1 Nucleotide-binding universal stress protein, UspA family [Virgibacillus subterraneus]